MQILVYPLARQQVPAPVLLAYRDEHIRAQNHLHNRGEYLMAKHSADPDWCARSIKNIAEDIERENGIPGDDVFAIFFAGVGLDPTPDAIAQLRDVFLPCLQIMCTRGYNPEGKTWKAHGWRGNLFYMKAKMERIWELAWRQGKLDEKDWPDLINYTGFYIRGKDGPPWGEWGEPG